MEARMRACRDCGHYVSRKAKKCPNCGRPNPTKAIESIVALVVLVTLGPLLICGCFGLLGGLFFDDEPAAVVDIEIEPVEETGVSLPLYSVMSPNSEMSFAELMRSAAQIRVVADRQTPIQQLSELAVQIVEDAGRGWSRVVFFDNPVCVVNWEGPSGVERWEVDNLLAQIVVDGGRAYCQVRPELCYGGWSWRLAENRGGGAWPPPVVVEAEPDPQPSPAQETWELPESESEPGLELPTYLAKLPSGDEPAQIRAVASADLSIAAMKELAVYVAAEAGYSDAMVCFFPDVPSVIGWNRSLPMSDWGEVIAKIEVVDGAPWGTYRAALSPEGEWGWAAD